MGHLYNIYLRAKKDYKAFRWVIEHFYTDWNIKIHHIGRGRNIEDLESYVLSTNNKISYKFLILGRGDVDERSGSRFIYRPNIVEYVIGKSKVRNARLEELAWMFEKARSFQRLCIKNTEKGIQLFGPDHCMFEPEPFKDLFVLSIPDTLATITGLEPGDYLVLRGLGGKHFFIDDNGIKGYMVFAEKYSPPRYIGTLKPSRIRIDELVELNRDVILREEEIVVNWLSDVGSGFERIIVPWSGGKDSTTALYLALKVFGPRHVYGVYAALDTDLPGVSEFVEEAADDLGLRNLSIIPVSIRKYLSSRGLPSHSNRWCTGLKIKALEEFYNEVCGNAKCLIVGGDRDVESERRSGRPPLQLLNDHLAKATPLKQWSTLLLQLYMHFRGIPVNPYYHEGFYRLGCYICPALRSWEIEVMLHNLRLSKILNDPVFRLFAERRGVPRNSIEPA